MVKGRRTFGVVFPILKEATAFIAAIASGIFLKKRTSVTKITTARMAQIERKWDLATKT